MSFQNQELWNRIRWPWWIWPGAAGGAESAPPTMFREPIRTVPFPRPGGRLARTSRQEHRLQSQANWENRLERRLVESK